MDTACAQCWGYDEVHPCICPSLISVDEPTYAVEHTPIGFNQDEPRIVAIWQRLVAQLA